MIFESHVDFFNSTRWFKNEKKVDVWEHVLRWGLEQNLTFLPDPKGWSDDDSKTMRNTLQEYFTFCQILSIIKGMLGKSDTLPNFEKKGLKRNMQRNWN